MYRVVYTTIIRIDNGKEWVSGHFDTLEGAIRERNRVKRLLDTKAVWIEDLQGKQIAEALV